MQLPISKNCKALDKAYTDGLSQAKQKALWPSTLPLTTLPWITVSSKYPSQGLSPDAEPSAAFGRIDRVYQENKISYIYFEEMPHKPLPIPLKRNGRQTRCAQSARKPDRRSNQGWWGLYLRDGENLKALKQTTDQEGPEIEPEKEENTKTVHNGCFEDADVKDRTLSDYAGNWQSVYPFLKMELLIKSLTTRLSWL